MSEQQRIEKEAYAFAETILGEPVPFPDDTIVTGYIAGANATRLRYIEQVKQILERANDKGMFYYEAIKKEIEKL